MTDLSFVLAVKLLSLSQTIPHSPRTALTPPHPQEYLWLRLPLCSHLLFDFVLYRPPNGGDSIYILLAENMDQLPSTHPNTLFLTCGDLIYHQPGVSSVVSVVAWDSWVLSSSPVGR